MQTTNKRDELRQSIFNEFNKEDLHIHLRDIIDDKHSRVTNVISPEIITSNIPYNPEDKHYSLMPVPGSIIVYAVKKCNTLFDDLKRAYTLGDSKALQKISKVIDNDVVKRKVISAENYVTELKKGSSYFDLAYDHKNLVANAGMVNGIEFGSFLLPWNGGKLNDESFKVIEYNKNFVSADYDILLVKCKPNLSKIEEEALRAVPANNLSLNIGSVAASPAACLALIAVFVLATHAGACNNFHDKIRELIYPVDQIKKIGEIASAADMLSQRRRVFESYGM